MKKKECPSCAMEIDDNEKICPICNYEFPTQSKVFQTVGYVLLIIIIVFFVLQMVW